MFMELRKLNIKPFNDNMLKKVNKWYYVPSIQFYTSVTYGSTESDTHQPDSISFQMVA